MMVSLNKRRELRSKMKGLQQELTKVSVERNFLSEEHTKRKYVDVKENLILKAKCVYYYVQFSGNLRKT